MAVNRSPVLVPFSGADLHTRRVALGLHNRGSVHRMLGYRVRSLEAWEQGRNAGPALDLAVVRMARLEKLADTITGSLVARALRTGVINTYRTDEDAAAAGAIVSDAAFHRVCAGHAAAECPDAQVEIDRYRDSEESSAGEKAQLLIRLSMLGITGKAVRHTVGVNQRILQLWLAGDREVRIFPDQMERIAEIECGIAPHRAVLERRLATTGIIPVAYSTEDLADIDPDTVIPPDTHRMIVGDLLADGFDARAEWVVPPPTSTRRSASRSATAEDRFSIEVPGASEV